MKNKSFLRDIAASAIGGAMVLPLSTIATDIRPKDLQWVVLGFGCWIIVSAAASAFTDSGARSKAIEALALAVILIATIAPIAKQRQEAWEIVSYYDNISADAAKRQLHRNLHTASSIYDEKEIREIFLDENHRYENIVINLFDIRYAGIAEWELIGSTTNYTAEEQIVFPFGSNAELPLDGRRFVSATDLRDGGEKELSVTLHPIRSKGSTYLYEVRIDDFLGKVHYRRTVCHPTAQTFNPEAFLLSLDLLRSKISDLEINIYSDKPLGKILLQEPANFNIETGFFDWAERTFPEFEGPIAEKEIARKQESLGEWAKFGQLRSGYRFKFHDHAPARLFIIYQKGMLEKFKFLGT